MRSKILFLIFAICLITQPAFSVTIDQQLGVGEVLLIPFTTPLGGIDQPDYGILSLDVLFIPIQQPDFFSANLFVGNSPLGSNSGSVVPDWPYYTERFAWVNQVSTNWGSNTTLIDFSPLLNGTNQGLIQVDPVLSSPLTIHEVNLYYGFSIDGGPTISTSPAGFAYSASIAPVPEPSTMLLLGTGLVGLVGFRRKFRK